MKIVLTGPVGSGKSTVVRAAMEELGWRASAGFFTRWGEPARTLFIGTWRGESHAVAAPIAAAADPAAPPYALDLALFGRIAIGSLSAPAGGPVVVDELGVLELGAKELVAAVAEVFRGPGPLLAVIQQRALESWMGLVGFENVTHLLTIDPRTRDVLPARIAALFRG